MVLSRSRKYLYRISRHGHLKHARNIGPKSWFVKAHRRHRRSYNQPRALARRGLFLSRSDANKFRQAPHIYSKRAYEDTPKLKPIQTWKPPAHLKRTRSLKEYQAVRAHLGMSVFE